MNKEEMKKSKKNKNSKIKSLVVVLPIIITIITLGLSGYLYNKSIEIMADAAKDSYDETKNEASEQVYEDFYEASRKVAEERYHTVNRITIQIGKIQEEEKLEVLRVSDVDYVIWDKDDKDNEYGLTSWRKVPATGVFTVNLKASEIIKDDERKYVLVRVPLPELTEFTTSDEKTLLLRTGLGNGSTADGADITAAQDAEAYSELKKSMATNSDYYDQSKKAAVTTIENLVKKMNPDIEDLTVEVEFFDEG